MRRDCVDGIEQELCGFQPRDRPEQQCFCDRETKEFPALRSAPRQAADANPTGETPVPPTAIAASTRAPAPIDEDAISKLFVEARSFSTWQDRSVAPGVLDRLFGLMSLCPTSANCSPARIVFVASAAAKEQLLPALHEGNREKTRHAPITAVIGYDLDFALRLPRLFPHAPDAASWFSQPEVAASTAFRNGSLQGGYFILAARSLGLDCGPMSGFDSAAVDELYFARTRIRTNFLCNLGYGDRAGLFPRSPRLGFDDACRIV
jgi:3-hydroxypropanoate dehydrogenase